jgi:integrase/recombinase XerD
MVRRYLDAAGITKTGACHLFRHTMATQLLEGGCDVRLIQAMLGHAKLDTTAMYTHVGIGHLKRAHTAHHPAENPPQIPPQIPPQA